MSGMWQGSKGCCRGGEGVRRRAIRFLAWMSLLACCGVALAWGLAEFRSDTAGWAGWRDEAGGVWQSVGMRSRQHRLTFYYFVGNFRLDDISVTGKEPQDMRPHFFDYVTPWTPPNIPGHGVLKRLGFETFRNSAK